MRSFRSFRFLVGELLVPVVLLLACETSEEAAVSPDLGGPGQGLFGELSPELAAKVLAVVGDTQVTLGDYALMIQRMDRFERMRYQSEDRRAALLDEMIHLELLSAEAKRRGLDKTPAAQALAWQSMRDELFSEIRRGLPKRASLSSIEVSEFFERHRSEFAVPEMRRWAQITVTEAVEAEKLLESALGSTDKVWADLVEKSRSGPKPSRDSSRDRLRVPGDRGFVARAGDDSDSVEEALRAAVFEIDRDGAVFHDVVAGGGSFSVIRRISATPARQRNLAEVEEVVRNRLLEDKFESARSALMARLRREFPVVIDEQALSRIPAPGGKGKP